MNEAITFFCLTPEPDEQDDYDYKQDDYSWMDDNECQENTFNIIPLTPEESTIDEDNHIHTTFQFFFKELGYFTEEPEPIDPTIDYEKEALLMNQVKNRKVRRRQHMDIISACNNNSNNNNNNANSNHNYFFHDNQLILA